MKSMLAQLLKSVEASDVAGLVGIALLAAALWRLLSMDWAMLVVGVIVLSLSIYGAVRSREKREVS